MLLLGLYHFITSASEFFKVLGIVVGSLRCFRERFSAVFAFACKCFSNILGWNLPLQVSKLLNRLYAVIKISFTLKFLRLLLLKTSLKRIHLKTSLKTIYGLFVRIHLEIPCHFWILRTNLEIYTGLVTFDKALVLECVIWFFNRSMRTTLIEL